MQTTLLLFAAGLLAGAMNAAAGGGSFVTLPALMLAGVPSVAANASSTVALFPGGIASVWAYRRAMPRHAGMPVLALLLVSLAGGAAGALILLATPQPMFDSAVPWLLLVATLAFAFGPRIGSALRGTRPASGRLLAVLQVPLALYGGYFGGAVGIMTMAVWSVLGFRDIRAMNAAKTLLVSATNAVAAVCFMAAGAVWWPATSVVLLGALLGGYAGARLALWLPAAGLRAAICWLNAAITAAFFWRAFMPA
jgi:uncharacterized membrane protein YfcA